MNKSLNSFNSDSGYIPNELSGHDLESTYSSGEFSLSEAEERNSGLVEKLNSLGVPITFPDHRVKPQSESDGCSAEYERRVGENGTITFYSGDESSVGSITKDGEEVNIHEFGHHVGHEISSWIHQATDYQNSDIDNEGAMERVRTQSYFQSENFADRFRVAVTGNDDIDLRSGRPENYSGTCGEKYAVDRENWDETLPELVDSLEEEVNQMVENLSEEGWEIEEPVI